MADLFTPEGKPLPFPTEPLPEVSPTEQDIDNLLRQINREYWGEEEGARQFNLLEAKSAQPTRKRKTPQKDKPPREALQVIADKAPNTKYDDPDFKNSLVEIPAFTQLPAHYQQRIHFFLSESDTPSEDLPFMVNYLAQLLDEDYNQRKSA